MRRAAVLVVLLAGAAVDAQGQDADRGAALTLAFDRDGTGWVSLTVDDPPGGRLNEAAVNRGLMDAVPTDWANADRRQLGARRGWFLRRWPAPPEKRAVRPLDLKPLLTALNGEGVTTLRLTVMVQRFGNVSCNLPTRPAPQGPALLYREDLVTAQPVPPVEIHFGERPTVPRAIVARAGPWSLALAALALLPVLFAAWRVRRLAASAETEHLGHALWRLFRYGPLATAIGWFVALGLTGGLALTTGWLDGPRPSGWLLRWLALFAAPPGAATLLAGRIVRPAFNRLRADDWVGLETLEPAPWAGVLQLIAAVLAASAAVLLFDGYGTLGLSALFVSWTVQRIADAVSEQQFGKVDDQSDTELAVNARALANVMGVRVKAVGVIASATRRAELYGTPKVVLTRPLVEHFARPAVDAVVAHGLARGASVAGSPVAGMVMAVSALFAAASGVAVVRYEDKLPAGVDWVPLAAAASLALFALAFRMMTRAANRAADGRAAWLTNPEVLVAALAEQERRRGEPPNRSWFEDVFLHRACVARRAAALARSYDWSPEDVARLLAAPVGADPSRYDVPLPPVPERLRNPFGVPTIVALVGLPLAFAYAAEACPDGTPRTLVLAAGVVGVPLLWGAVLWLVNSRRNATWRGELHSRLRSEGIGPEELSGSLVAFAPDREAHSYGGSPQWDLGYLVPAGDRLLFIGRRVRAAVPWAATGVSVASGPFSRRPSRIVVSWDGGASAGEPSPVPDVAVRSDGSSLNATDGAGAFSVWPAGRRVPWGFARALAELSARLQEWRDCRVKADLLPGTWATLPPPPPTPPGAKPFRESLRIRVVLGSIGMLGGLVLMAAASLGLPSRAAWYGFAVVVVTVLASTVPPFLLARGRR